MKPKPYELIEHTADIGLRIFGKDRQELFVNAALGMFSILAKKKKTKEAQKKQSLKIDLSASNLEELLVSWLGELLSLSDIKKAMFTHFQISELTDTRIKAKVFAEKNYTTKTEIKAATYHQLEIKKEKDFWQAEVIFDV